MPVMPSRFENSWYTRKLCEFMDPRRNPPYNALIEAIQALPPGEPAARLFIDPDTPGLPAATKRAYQRMIDHLRADWYTDGQGYWPTIPDKGTIMNTGYIAMIAMARDTRFPVSHVWVCGGDAFQIMACVTGPVVNMTVLTPMISVPDHKALPHEYEQLRVVTDEAEARHIVAESKRLGLGKPLQEQVAPGVYVTDVEGAPMPH